jgi:hypothetical protein
MTAAKNNNANEVYQTAKNDIANLMGFVTNELTKPHDEITWSQVGSLQHVRRNLIETLSFLSGIEERSIEETLKDMQECE